MRLRVIWTGKTKDTRLRELQLDYEKRLSHFTRCEVVEIRESSAASSTAGIDKDSRSISDRLSNGAVAVRLDPSGNEWSSQELAAQIQRWENQGTKEVVFIVGGPNGVSPELAKRAQQRWSLSRLTLTHEMARVVLMEQLYRAYTIIHGLPYQK
jgi:23S rRNA (pseudouridine1915-N3)-methyltransferase